MVLWTRGICTRFVRPLMTFLLLCAGICLLLFFITTSHIRWPGLAFTTLSQASETSASSHTVAPAFPTPRAFSIPVILQNPTVVPSTPWRAEDTWPVATAPAQNWYQPPVQLSPTSVSSSVQPTPRQELSPTPERSEQQPPLNDWLTNSISANGHLAGGLIDSPIELENLFWPAFIVTLLTISGCVILFLILQRKRHCQS